MELVSEISADLYAHHERYGVMPLRFPVSEATFAELETWLRENLTHHPWTNETQAKLGYQNVMLRGVAIYPERDG